MSETSKFVTIPAETVSKLRLISERFGELNTGATGDEFWIAGCETGGYEWSQIDIGVNKQGQLVTCSQSGCSCNSPEAPTPDATYPLTGAINIPDVSYENVEQEALKELVTTTATLHDVLTGTNVSAKDIIGLPNAELRRAVIELVGYDKILDHAEVLDSSEIDGRLLRIALPEDEDLVLVHVKDPSTEREYFLRVPPKMNTAKEARAWTFGFEAADFDLAVER